MPERIDSISAALVKRDRRPWTSVSQAGQIVPTATRLRTAADVASGV
jgi:hypothetical protein